MIAKNKRQPEAIKVTKEEYHVEELNSLFAIVLLHELPQHLVIVYLGHECTRRQCPHPTRQNVNC